MKVAALFDEEGGGCGSIFRRVGRDLCSHLDHEVAAANTHEAVALDEVEAVRGGCGGGRRGGGGGEQYATYAPAQQVTPKGRA